MTRNSATRESTWTRRLCAEMEAQGAFVLPIVGSAMQHSGTPDRYVLFKLGELGAFQGWLEFKGARTVVAPLQSAVMAQMAARGANVFIIRASWARRWPTICDIHDVPLMHFDDTGQGLMAVLLKCAEELTNLQSRYAVTPARLDSERGEDS